MVFPLHVTICFSVAAFKILSLSLVFAILVIMCIRDVSYISGLKNSSLVEEPRDSPCRVTSLSDQSKMLQECLPCGLYAPSYCG